MSEVMHGSANEHVRYAERAGSRSRKKCKCCGYRATHMGKANGVALVQGCELRVRRWVRDGTKGLVGGAT